MQRRQAIARQKHMRAAFLDLNGTLVLPVRVTHPVEYTPISGAVEAVRLLNQHGFICPIVTVQSRIAKQIFSRDDFMHWFRIFQADLRRCGAEVLGPYLCPHQGRDACACKKPQPYLYQQVAAASGIAIERSVVVGDTLDDVRVAHALACSSCLVRTGWGEQAVRMQAPGATATHVAADILDAAHWVVATLGSASA